VDFTDQSTGTTAFWDWDFGDGAISQQANPTHVYQNPGTYQVCLTVNGACTSNTFCDSIDVMAVGLAASQMETVQLYPNPVEDVLGLLLPENMVGEVSIMNAQGKVIRHEGEVQSSLRMDVRDLPAGMYFVEFRQGGERITNRFVKF
ncbi:MAG: PKD domain-containing protein, partial [Bacteroidota bacterium]